MYTFILNPVAGNGTAGKKRKEIKDFLEGRHIPYRILETQAIGHATALATQAVENSAVVVAIGGDGTIHEVVQGLVTAQKKQPERDVAFGMIPIGTGNDFVKMFDIASDLNAALETLLQTNEPSRVDYGVVRWKEGEEQGERIFVNVVGVGFDAYANIESKAFKFLPGTLAYLAAVLRTLRRWSAPKAEITYCDGVDPSKIWYEGPLFMALVGNGRCEGGGFYLTPAASITDGVFDICVIEGTSMGRILRILPKVFSGNHLAEPEVHMHRDTGIRITVPAGMPIHADGEVLAHAAEWMEVAIVSQGLPVMAPLASENHKKKTK